MIFEVKKPLSLVIEGLDHLLLLSCLQDADYYREAWDISASRCARAQRSLGLWHLRREEFQETVECLQKSLVINSLQAGIE